MSRPGVRQLGRLLLRAQLRRWKGLRRYGSRPSEADRPPPRLAPCFAKKRAHPTMATSSSGPRGGPNSYAALRASPAAVPSSAPQARSSCAGVNVIGRVSFCPPAGGLVLIAAVGPIRMGVTLGMLRARVIANPPRGAKQAIAALGWRQTAPVLPPPGGKAVSSLSPPGANSPSTPPLGARTLVVARSRC